MRQCRWLELLHKYDFQIQYQAGKDNVVVDALSRKSILATITMLQTNLSEAVRQFYQQDLFFTKITSALLAHPKSEKQSWVTEGFQLVDGLLYYKRRLYDPPHKEIQQEILSKAHDIPITAHPGYIKMYNTLCKSFWWHGMKRDILAYVTRCLSCQRIKAERIRYPSKLHPHDIPQMKWENISMDFVTRLPTSKGYDSIFVVVDMLTKVAHLFPITNNSTAKDVA